MTTHPQHENETADQDVSPEPTHYLAGIDPNWRP